MVVLWGNATDCYDIKVQVPDAPSGVYYIETWQTFTTLSVYCDMDTDGGGWTVSFFGSNFLFLAFFFIDKRFLNEGPGEHNLVPAECLVWIFVSHYQSF